MRTFEENLSAWIGEVAADGEAVIAHGDSVDRLVERLEGVVAFEELTGEPDLHRRTGATLWAIAAAVLLVLGLVAALVVPAVRAVPRPAGDPGESLPWMLRFGWLPDGVTVKYQTQVDPRILDLRSFDRLDTGVEMQLYRSTGGMWARVVVSRAIWKWGANTTLTRGKAEVPAIWHRGGDNADSTSLTWTDPSGVNIAIDVGANPVSRQEIERVAEGMQRVDRARWEALFADNPVVARGEVDGLRWIRTHFINVDAFTVTWKHLPYRVVAPASDGLMVSAAQVVGSDLAGVSELVVPTFGAGCRRVDLVQHVERELPTLPPGPGVPAHLYLLSPVPASVSSRGARGVQLYAAGWLRTSDGRRDRDEPNLEGHCVVHDAGEWSALYPGFPK